MIRGAAHEETRLGDVVWLVLAVAGIAACITLVYLAMRAVMDVGGACADGGPYVSAQPCPDGATPALLLGVFGLFGFGALGMWAGARIGGYAWLPLLAWTGLFASLGWNFLDYGLVNPPEGQGVEWGYVIPGILFQLMAWVPIAFVAWALWDARRSTGGTAGRASVIRANVLRAANAPAGRSSSAWMGSSRSPASVSVAARAAAGLPSDRRAELAEIDALLGAAAATGPTTAGSASVTGSAAADAPSLLDRLDRLTELLDRGLLTQGEFDTAKAALMHELEART